MSDQDQQAGDQTKSAPQVSKLQGFLFNLESRFALVLLILGVFGILLLFIGIVIENRGHGLSWEILILFVKEMGILLFAIVTTSLVHDRFLRSHSLKEVENALRAQFLDQSFRDGVTDVIRNAIKGQLPQNYVNIKESGIVDAFAGLWTDKLVKKIKKLDKGSEVFILKVWLTGIDKLAPAISEAVTRGCKFRIIILHPDEIEVFEKRGRILSATSSITINSEIMKDKVIDSIKRLKLLKQGLKENHENLEIKLHKDFVSASIFGSDLEVLVGFYLHNRLAENNMQLKIRGNDTAFYKAFKEHFDLQWDHAAMMLEEYDFQKAAGQ